MPVSVSLLSRTREEPPKRSSSLPPEQQVDRTYTTAGTSTSRGRPYHNPIGTNRQLLRNLRDPSSVERGARGASVERGGRSQSLNRRDGSVERNGGGGERGGRLSRTNSFASSVGSDGSNIFEPSWFSHAFGSEAVGGGGSGGMMSRGESRSPGRRRRGNSVTRRGSSGEVVGSSGDPPKNIGYDEKGSKESYDKKNSRESNHNNNKEEERTETTATTTKEGTSSAAAGAAGGGGYSIFDDPLMSNFNFPSSSSNDKKVKNKKPSNDDADGQSSTVTSFTAQNQSIQSELLGESGGGGEHVDGGKNHSLSGKPKTMQENEVSSITMDTAINTKKSKSFMNNVKQNTIGKIKKKSKSFHHHGGGGEFDQSENSLQSESTAGSISTMGSRSVTSATSTMGTSGTNASDKSGSRRRGRSLGLKLKRGTGGGNNNNNNNNNNKSKKDGNPHPYSKRRSRSQTVREEKVEEQRVRERSRSIVRDARSFIEAIEKGSDVKDADRNHKRSESFHSIGTHTASNITSGNNSSSSSSSSSKGVSLRNNKFKDGSRKESQDDGGSSVGSSSNNVDEKTKELLASLKETNLENENTIKELQEQLTDLTNERNAFRNNSERMMEIMTKQKSQLEKELKTERKGFAETSHSHKKEIEEWKSKARNAEKKVKKLEGDLVEKEGVIKLTEVHGMREKEKSDTNNDGEAVQGHDGPLEREASLMASSMGIDVSLDIPATAAQSEKNLHCALLKLSVMESSFISEMQQLKSENEGMKKQVDEWKDKHSQLDKQHQDLLEERDDEAAMVNALENKLEGCRLVIESMTKSDDAAVGTSISAVNDELVERIGDLADENGRLLSKYQKLEREAAMSASSMDTSLQDLANELKAVREENTEALATIETLKFENRNLRMSFGKDDDQEDKNRSKKNQISEKEHKEALAMIKDMQAENDSLHKSMEEAINLASGMNDKMSSVVATHEMEVKEYQAKLENVKEELKEAKLSKEELSSKLDSLKKENRKLSAELEEANSTVANSIRDEMKKEQSAKDAWTREKRELSSTIDNLKKENDKLHESMKEMNSLVAAAEECVDKLSDENTSLKSTQEYYQQQLEELNVEKEANAYLREEIKNVSSEREDAYDTCKVLQQEINLLQQSVEESKERLQEHLHNSSDRSMSSEVQERLADLTKSNEALTKELEQKNEALQAVQSALENLKDEQSTIRETIVELRTENAKLRDTQLVPGPPPKSILKQPHQSSNMSHDSDSSQIYKLEKAIKKVEKENKGLREANSTLSAKLFDEMEKTDALRVANEGLAARICKLVAFIQQNPGGAGGGAGGSGGAASSSGVSGSASKRSKSPAPPRKKK